MVYFCRKNLNVGVCVFMVRGSGCAPFLISGTFKMCNSLYSIKKENCYERE